MTGKLSSLRGSSRRAASLLGCALVVVFAGAASAAPRPPRAAQTLGDRAWLSAGRVSGATDNADHGRNASKVILLKGADGVAHKALFKPRAGETAVFGDVVPGTYYHREAAASDLADALGMTFVPQTVIRNVGGRKGSAMAWVDGAVRAADADPKDWQIDRAEGEQLRAFDYLIGNGDRHVKNLLMTRDDTGKVHPVAIDHGLAFPLGVMFRWNLPARFFDHAQGPLLPETRAFIAGISPTKVAAVLAANKVEPFAAAFALRRLARLKADPSFLQIERNDQVANIGSDPEQGLRPAQLARIDRTIDAAYRP